MKKVYKGKKLYASLKAYATLNCIELGHTFRRKGRRETPNDTETLDTSETYLTSGYESESSDVVTYDSSDFGYSRFSKHFINRVKLIDNATQTVIPNRFEISNHNDVVLTRYVPQTEALSKLKAAKFLGSPKIQRRFEQRFIMRESYPSIIYNTDTHMPFKNKTQRSIIRENSTDSDILRERQSKSYLRRTIPNGNGINGSHGEASFHHLRTENGLMYKKTDQLTHRERTSRYQALRSNKEWLPKRLHSQTGLKFQRSIKQCSSSELSAHSHKQTSNLKYMAEDSSTSDKPNCGDTSSGDDTSDRKKLVNTVKSFIDKSRQSTLDSLCFTDKGEPCKLGLGNERMSILNTSAQERVSTEDSKRPSILDNSRGKSKVVRLSIISSPDSAPVSHKPTKNDTNRTQGDTSKCVRSYFPVATEKHISHRPSVVHESDKQAKLELICAKERVDRIEELRNRCASGSFTPAQETYQKTEYDGLFGSIAGISRDEDEHVFKEFKRSKKFSVVPDVSQDRLAALSHIYNYKKPSSSLGLSENNKISATANDDRIESEYQNTSTNNQFMYLKLNQYYPDNGLEIIIIICLVFIFLILGKSIWFGVSISDIVFISIFASLFVFSFLSFLFYDHSNLVINN